MLDFTKEQHLLHKYKKILGIDEAGRGPWAGPLVVAGVLITQKTQFLQGVDDSKKLSEKKREILYQEIIQSHEYYVTIIPHTEIDSLGIGNAQIKAMQHLIEELTAEWILIDGYFKPHLFGENVESIIDGDALCYSIAAASIIAKYTRDKIMEEMDERYPEYNFKKHKGYGTKEHAEKLILYGPCDIHRRSYKPVQKFI